MSFYTSSSGRRTLTADRVIYDNTGTNLTALDAQGAITELAGRGAGDILTHELPRVIVMSVSPLVIRIVTDTGILTGIENGDVLTA